MQSFSVNVIAITQRLLHKYIVMTIIETHCQGVWLLHKCVVITIKKHAHQGIVSTTSHP